MKCPPIFGHGIKFTTKIDKGEVTPNFWTCYKIHHNKYKGGGHHGKNKKKIHSPV